MNDVAPISFSEIKEQDPAAAKLFSGLKLRHKRFVCYYLQERNASAAYRMAYQNPAMKAEISSALGGRLMKRPDVKAFLDAFLDRRIEAYHKVVDTYMDMMDATQPHWVQDKDGQWENAGDIPNWKARGSGAGGISKLYGFNEEAKNQENLTGPHISGNFQTNFNIYLESKGESPVEVNPEEEVKSGRISKFANEFKQFTESDSET